MSLTNKVLAKFGLRLTKLERNDQVQYPDLTDNEFWHLYALCKPFTMTSVDRMFGLYTSVRYVLEKNIPGDFVECGVWRGGSSLMMAKMLSDRNITDRKIFLYDTFEGMPPPSKKDRSFDGADAQKQLDENANNKEESVWCLADLNDVRKNLSLSNLSTEQILYVQGKVEDTIPQNVPENIALLRLDTDWYESTKHELTHLYPILKKDGVLIIDDYGHWEGCRKAVDEYFAGKKNYLLFHRLDYTGRMATKNHD